MHESLAMPEIRGRVVDDQHRAVSGVRVELFSDQVGMAPGAPIAAAAGEDNGGLIQMLSGRRLGQATTDNQGNYTLRYEQPTARDLPYLLYYLPDALEPIQVNAINPGRENQRPVHTVLRGRPNEPPRRRVRSVDSSRVDQGISPIGVTHNVYAQLESAIASGDADLRRQMDELALRYDEDQQRILNASNDGFGDALVQFDHNERWRRANAHQLLQTHMARWMDRAQTAAQDIYMAMDGYLMVRTLTMGLAEISSAAVRRVTEAVAERRGATAGTELAERGAASAARGPAEEAAERAATAGPRPVELSAESSAPRLGARNPAAPPLIAPGSALPNAPRFHDYARRGIFSSPAWRTQLAQGPYSNCWACCIRMIFRDLGVELGEQMATNQFTIHGARDMTAVLRYLRLQMCNKIPGLITSAGRYEFSAIQNVVMGGTNRTFMAAIHRPGWVEAHVVIVDAVRPAVIRGQEVIAVWVRDPNGFSYVQRVSDFMAEYLGEGIFVGI